MLKFSESSDIISINGKKKKEIKLGDCKNDKKKGFQALTFWYPPKSIF